jgi:thiosulfate/3-mercaptopyruvate sulfurtransferase
LELNVIYTTLISAPDLIANISQPNWAIIDCRFSLADPDLGRQNYMEAHIPGAVYAHLDEDLCSPWIKGETGRHPLPDIEAFTEKVGDWGINSSSKVIAYDDAGGSMAAARLWWLMRWLGHYSVAVLDGGWQSWLNTGEPVTSGQEERSSSMFIPRIKQRRLIETSEILARLQDPDFRLLDSRDETRYKGEFEPIDPVAGHIPGALSFPHQEVLDEQGKFLPSEVLRQLFQPLLGDIPAKDTAFYCGSGVTSAQNVLAMAYAGLGDARLYAGSWSEWITDPERPIATSDRY